MAYEERTREEQIQVVLGVLKEPIPSTADLAKCIVDALHAPKRIVLSGGFHAVPPAKALNSYSIYRSSEHVGWLTKDAVDAWVLAAKRAGDVGALVGRLAEE